MIDRDDFSPKHAHADKQRAMHFAIVSTEIPPAASGQARVLGHLLVADNVKWTLLTEHVPEGGCWPGSSVQALSPPRFRVPRGFYRSGLANGVDGALVFDICRRAAEITYILQQERPSLLIGCSGSPFDLPAANLAARQLGIPFVAYLFDDPVFQWPPGKFRELAAWQEQIWSHHVTALITPNEFLSAEIKRRTTLEAHVIRNPAVISSRHLTPPQWNGDVTKIVYTGSVYHAQADAFQNLICAIRQMPNYELHIYTSQPASALAEYGICGPAVIQHEHVSYEDVRCIHENADILFLPLAFRSEIQEVLLTSAPGKLGEYLASGRPILVHAPENSFVCDYFKRTEAGIVVDQPDPDALETALRRLRDEPEFVRNIVQNALEASSEFEVTRVREQFLSLLATLSKRES